MFPVVAFKYHLFIAMKFESKVLKVEMENHANLVVISNVPIEFTPSIGKEFDSEEICIFYNEYGRRVRFGIRKKYANKLKKTGIITYRRFVNEKEGIQGKDK